MSENSEMTCAELADVAAELALGVLTGRERAMAVEHLDNCDTCREDVRQLMATGEQLLELLPPAEPPAGFETRTLERLGLPAPPEEPAPPRRIARRDSSPRLRGPSRGGARPAGNRPGGDRPSGKRRPGPMRRALAATAVSLAVIAAGLGGWRIGASTATEPLSTASLVTATHRTVGNFFLYSGDPRWVYMHVELGSGNEMVTCQLVGADGQVSTLGSFWLGNGYGQWGGSAEEPVKGLHSVQIVSPTGDVLASATITH